MGRQGKHDQRWKAPFLELFAKTGVVAEACRRVGISRDTLYRALKNDKEFQARFDDAEKDAGDVLEGEAWRRAVEGNLHVPFNPRTGKPYLLTHDPKTGEKLEQPRDYVEMRYSDRLLMALLKARKPETFGDKVQVEDARKIPALGLMVLEHTAPPDPPIQ